MSAQGQAQREAISQCLAGYRVRLVSAIEEFEFSSLRAFVELLIVAREQGNVVYLAGNGGSASTCGHIAVDWMMGTGITDPPLKVVSLADSSPSITATGNDFDFEDVFSRQLRFLGESGDVLVLVSASGMSRNLISAAELASAQELKVVSVTGFDGGRLAEIADISLHVATRVGDYGVAEDIHLAIGHAVKEALIATQSGS